MPPTVFGQPADDYLEEKMVTIFMSDNGDWTIFNDLDDAAAPTESSPAANAISMSEGTLGFISSMDIPDDSSDVGTVLEVASSEDIKELTR